MRNSFRRRERDQRDYKTALRRMTKTVVRGPEAEEDPEETGESPAHPVIGLRLMPEARDYLFDDFCVLNQPIRALTIGASPDCDICVEDVAASAIHCLITRFRAHVYASDAGSKNGLYVNDRRVPTRELFEGCTLRVGRTSFVAISARSRERPIVSGSTHKSFIHNAYVVYGSIRKAARGLRLPYTTYRHWLKHGRRGASTSETPDQG